ncbi:MAG: TetR/AcrR family transcriptional regulator [Acidobacteriota bacterium]
MVSDWRERRKQELRRLLYETALELFQAQGYEGTTVQQITETLNVAKGTFFNHFPTKEHVVAEWYNGITYDSMAAARARTPATVEDAVCDLFADMSGRATDAPELLIAKARLSNDDLLADAERNQDREIDAYVLELCRGGKTSGELAADLDVEFFVETLGAVLTGSSRAWVRSEERFDFPALIRKRVRFLFRAAKATS